MHHLGEKTFLQDDQEHFARISGDVNPMHMDAVAARRLIVGQQVVHGVHVLLTAMEYSVPRRAPGSPSSRSIQCTFNNPVTVGDGVVFHQHSDTPGELTVEATVGDLRCAHIVLGTLANPAPVNLSPALTSEPTRHAASVQDVVVLPALSQPLEDPSTLLVGQRYAIRPVSADWKRAFPGACQVWGPDALASIAALSYIVGMVCPGLHSIFSSIDVHVKPTAEWDGLLYFSVSKYDPRFSLFEIQIDGAISGHIRAFVRPAPQRQPTTRELMAEVVANEFKGTQALVIGGSRGLGEVTAKLLAAGGAEVTITYAAGVQDAQAVCDDINSVVGAARCGCQKLDLTQGGLATLRMNWESVDAIYFYATPKIFKKKEAIFDGGSFDNFFNFYIRDFYEICTFLEKTVVARQVRVYLPSTVFIADRPKGMTEYAMAKAAAEVLVQDINRSFKHVEVICTRLPRLNTDQNAAIRKEKAQSNVATLLPLIRSVQHHVDQSVPRS
jgi:NAD(P)-dependent dehydrogenase (short-subunit alcohol dehydrogenase family)